MADKFDALFDEVSRQTSLTESVLALVEGFATQLEEAKDDPEQIAAIAAKMRASNDAIAAALTANTPVAVTSEEPPPPVPPPPGDINSPGKTP